VVIFNWNQKPIGYQTGLSEMCMQNNFLIQQWLNEWTFKSRNKLRYTHSLHRYPAMFIPELAEKIIKMYSNEGDVVLDIFSGSGTTILESIINQRVGLGLELNPFAYFISNSKITLYNLDEINSFMSDLDYQSLQNINCESVVFDKIDFWFHKDTIISISKYLYFINKISNENSKNFFKLCLSEIIREISFCNHSGFKMHRDKKKFSKGYNTNEFIDKLQPVLNRNLQLITAYTKFVCNSNLKDYLDNSKIYLHDTTNFNPDIGKESVDLILTSPPYGDSKTTVAYGQFSYLSMQILGIGTTRNSKISQIDNELLGGKTEGIDPYKYTLTSLTLQNIQELFLSRVKLASTPKESKRELNRLKDIISFYSDLDLALKNAYLYLKKNKYFILVTASRVVHNTKLHTDQIIAELGSNYGFKLKNIHYRDIHNKRMPSKVSATNITGQTAPTMTEESIIVLQKI